MGFLIRVLANALAILAAAYVLPGIEVNGGMALLAAGLVLALINAVVRPVLIFLTLPFTLVTLGLFLFVLNAFLSDRGQVVVITRHKRFPGGDVIDIKPR